MHKWMNLSMITSLWICSRRHSTFNPMTSKDNWPRVDLGYKIKKHKLRRKPGRPRISRIKSYQEAGTSKKRKSCSECNEIGHIAKYCQGGLTASQKRKLSSSQNGPSSQTSV
jgi:hypothetical protein